MSSLRGLIGSGMTCGVVAALLLGLSPGVATAQSVRGSGNYALSSSHGAADGGNDFLHFSVNAWLDDQGVAHGTVTFEGDVFQSLPGGGIRYGGPSEPFIYAVTDIVFDGNTAYVAGVVIASPEGVGDGLFGAFVFTDNSATGAPDVIDGLPIDAGNIAVDD